MRHSGYHRSTLGADTSDTPDHKLNDIDDTTDRADGDHDRLRDTGPDREPGSGVCDNPSIPALEHRAVRGRPGARDGLHPDSECGREPERPPESQGADHGNRGKRDVLVDYVTKLAVDQQHDAVLDDDDAVFPRHVSQDGVCDLPVVGDVPETTERPARLRQLRLDEARREADSCRRCDLWQSATQTVFGAGPVDPDVMLVGEQPGDQEDKAGKPFVGPAGRVLEDALQAAGLAATKRYVTNAVKHFRWEPRGKRRIHLKPNPAQLLACQYWLEQEIEFVKPKLVVALGATAVRALLGSTARVLRDRGKAFTSRFGDVIVTVHPSSILRAPDADSRKAAMAAFVLDLKAAAKHLRTQRR